MNQDTLRQAIEKVDALIERSINEFIQKNSSMAPGGLNALYQLRDHLRDSVRVVPESKPRATKKVAPKKKVTKKVVRNGNK